MTDVHARVAAVVLCFPLLAASLAAAGASEAGGVELRFNRDIRPLLSENCFHCHGPDAGARKANLRLDTRDGLFGRTKKRGPVVTAGAPEKSELWLRVSSGDSDEAMPPAESHKVLKPGEKETLRRWIAAGAPWQPHWAFIRPERPPLPAVKNAGWVRNPIDRFVLARLEAAGLMPAPEADRRTLARRLALDLTGLPPEPAEVDAFVGDGSPGYYERYVTRLLNSPRWGEHRGRYWLDAARYADTHGLHFDNYREIWPYRDWVIRAFNRNEPFDQFTVQQIAGDLLPDPTDEDLIATGFHRCNTTTNEGGTIEEENLANYARDRVETTCWVWLGLTANCAVCHDHKFDPITTRDFYSMSAYFRNTTQNAYDGNVRDTAPMLSVPSEGDRARWRALPREITAAEASMSRRRLAASPAFEEWLITAKPESIDRLMNLEALAFFAPLAEGRGDPVASVGPPLRTEGEPKWQTDAKDGKIGPALPLGPSLRLEAPAVGDFERDQAFSVAAWIRPGKGDVEGSVLARMDEGRDYRGWDLYQSGKRLAVHLVSQWDQDAIKVSTRREALSPGEWQHVVATYDGSSRAGGIKLYVNGREQEVSVDRDTLKSSIRTEVAFRVGGRHRGQVFDSGFVQDLRVYRRVLPPAEAALVGDYGFARSALALSFADRRPRQRNALFDFYLTRLDAPYQQIWARLEGLKGEQVAIRQRSPVTLIQQERAGTEPKAHILYRGQYDQPRDEVRANVFGWLAPPPAESATNRLGLAGWLVSRENPLPARVTVNRFWQEVFGAGLVRTSVDFGTMGELPSNQDLLDWLAVEFQESGWDVKRLFREMVTSAAYRQSAAVTPAKLEADPENRLISRGPRFRLDAEMIRDYALTVSGLLGSRVGGPSVKPYQPERVWESVAMPESNTRNYLQDHGESLYRRSLYDFWKRAAPPANLEALNAPSRETACLRRERTDTPIQALVTLDDPQFVEAARLVAERCLRTNGGRPEAVLGALASRILLRSLSPNEAAVALSAAARFEADYQAHPEAAGQLLAVGEFPVDPAIPPARLAAWTLLANGFLNLDEALNK